MRAFGRGNLLRGGGRMLGGAAAGAIGMGAASWALGGDHEGRSAMIGGVLGGLGAGALHMGLGGHSMAAAVRRTSGRAAGAAIPRWIL
jgi:hypothetical protein